MIDSSISLAERALFSSVAPRCAADVQHHADFCRPEPVKGSGADGPSSNTGQKSEEPGALIDYLTFVVPASALEERGLTRLDTLLWTIFSTRDELRVVGLRERLWQHYRQSAYIIDQHGELCGRIGLDGNGDTVCVSLSGQGTKHCRSWHKAQMGLEALKARITRCDVAYDDYDGQILSVHDMRQRAHAGEFTTGGRPPQCSFTSDEGSGKGSTLYVGSKGNRQACVYEKGKKQGMPASSWVRAEVRFYAKHAVIPLDILTSPLRYLRGAYPPFAELLQGVCERIKTTVRTAQATAHAFEQWMRTQVGKSINFLRDVFGDSWSDYADQRIAREGVPVRFRSQQGPHLHASIRSQLCPSFS